MFYSYEKCNLCPRGCHSDRTQKAEGFCRQTDKIKLALASLHFGEEPPVTGTGGSGTLFFSGCTLQCSFCQNWQISHKGFGSEISSETLADLMITLQEKGAENINCITGTQFIPGITEALQTARKKGLILPLVWNTSGYEKYSALGMLNEEIKIYLPDLKTLNPSLSKALFQASDYPDAASNFVLEAIKKRPVKWEGDQLREGVIIRHLVLPGYMDETRDVLAWFQKNAMEKAVLSLMFQYTPVSIPTMHCLVPDRRISEEEYEEVLYMLDDFGIEEGFIQELEDPGDWLPDFSHKDSFSSSESSNIWYNGNLTEHG